MVTAPRQMTHAAVGDVVEATETDDGLAINWADSLADVSGNVIETLMTVTLLPVARGRKPSGGYFDTASVRIDWKAPPSAQDNRLRGAATL